MPVVVRDTRRLSLLVLVACVAAVAGCPADPPDEGGGGCTEGEQKACACVGGAEGAQVCQDDGTFSTCECPGPCVPRSCQAAGAECGEIDDGCGVPLICGGCEGGRECNGNLCACAGGEVVLNDTCDVDECADATDTCDANAACTNTLGSFTCACNSGFLGDGNGCDPNQCAAGTDNCSADATCTDTATGFTCACNTFFVGDGATCVADIDTTIADYTNRPIELDIPGIGIVEVERSTKISAEWDFIRVPQATGGLPVYTTISYPAVTFGGIRGSATEIANVLAWVNAADPRLVRVLIYGIGGELVGPQFVNAVPSAIDSTVTIDGAESVITSMRLTPGTIELSDTVESSILPNPAPGYWFEIEGVESFLTNTGFTFDQITPLAEGPDVALLVQGVPRHENVIDWFNGFSAFFLSDGIMQYRALSLITVDAARLETARINGFECTPDKLYYLDPTRDPTFGFPTSVSIVCMVAQDAN